MTLQINLSWWAQGILVVAISLGLLLGKVSWKSSLFGTVVVEPAQKTESPKEACAVDGWTNPQCGWMASPTVGQ